MRCRWLLWLVAAELVAQQLHWGVALGGIGSVGISGTAAMLSNPAGLCAQPDTLGACTAGCLAALGRIAAFGVRLLLRRRRDPAGMATASAQPLRAQ
jgi:hypothetical protein